MGRAVRVGVISMAAALAMVAAACAGDDAPPPAEFAPRIEVFAPVDEAEVVTLSAPATGYGLRIVSGLPNSCAKYNNTLVNVSGAAIAVDVRNTIPSDDRVACAQVYGSNERTVELKGLAPDTDYTITINAALELSLTTRAAAVVGQRPVDAPLAGVRLEMVSVNPPAYEAVVDSGLESTCMTRGEVHQSRSGGRLFGDLIRVNLVNMEEIEPDVACSEQFSPYQVRVTLPGTFALGNEYELELNQDERYAFTGGATALRRLK